MYNKLQTRAKLIYLLLWLTTTLAVAQNGRITGRVTDIQNSPLAGVSILVKGTTTGTTTDAKGMFTLPAKPDDQVLFSFIGYQSQEIRVGGQTTINVTLQEANKSLNEVIVTAQKREESAQRTPISIGVLSGTSIAQRAINTLDVALKNITGVEVQGLAQGAQVYIRGVGSSIDPTFADPAVALMVDGAYNGRTESVTGGIYDLERVEVLRGPQGTLYGRNASGGSINVLTANPILNKTTGYVRGQVGNYGLWKVEAMGNVGLGNKAALRVAGFRQKRNGYVDDGSYNADNWGIRAKLLFKPTQRLSIVAKADIYREGGTGVNTLPVPGSGGGNLFFPPPFFVSNFDPTITTGPPFTGGVPILRFPNGWQVKDPGNAWSNNPEHVPSSIDRKSESYSLQLDADLGFANLTVLSTYTRNRNSLTSSFLFGSILPFQGPTFDTRGYGGQPSETRYSSIETRLTSSGSGPLKYLLGLYYLNADGGNTTFDNTATTTTGQALTTSNPMLPNSTLAAFGQLTYAVTKKFRLTGGLRYSVDKNAQQYEIKMGEASQGKIDFSQAVSNVQYKIGTEIDLAAQSMLYAHLATGFKQGGINVTVPPQAFEPEYLTSIEAGVKNRFAANRIQLNVSAFHYNY